MEVNVATTTATTSFNWSGRRAAAIYQCPSVSQTLTSSNRRPSRGDVSVGGGGGGSLVACQTRLTPSSFLGTQSGKLHRSRSCELWQFPTAKKHYPLRRVCSARSGFFSDEDFSLKMQELALHFKLTGEEDEEEGNRHRSVDNDCRNHRIGSVKLLEESVPGLASLEAPWIEMVNHSSIERKANSVDLPLSLRMIKRKLLQEETLKEATYCSINRAFSSMVFMIQELHSFSLQSKETILYQDLECLLKHVKKDMHASLLWIFQRVFSQTPTLMLYLMILLANFTVHSVASSLVIEASPPHSVAPPSEYHGARWVGPVSSVSGQGIREEELSLWDSIVEEADQMNGSPLDHDMRMSLVSPVTARIELEDYANYSRTEAFYEIGLAKEPSNPLLLVNFAQFLYLVCHDYDRADKCFKKAIESEEVDAEAYSKYAIFQWKVRKDLWAAEENFLEAIAADPTNSFYAASYANFLWQTGGDETCYPIESAQEIF